MDQISRQRNLDKELRGKRLSIKNNFIARNSHVLGSGSPIVPQMSEIASNDNTFESEVSDKR